MSGSESLYRIDTHNNDFVKLQSVNAGELNIKEKEIENWVAGKPELLFTDPNSVMIIAQEIKGELQADILAVDSQGNLITVEIKRHGSDRNVIGQILDYAARLSEWSYEQFNQRWKAYPESKGIDLFDAFQRFIENDAFNQDDFLRNQRLYILAAEEDECMRRIIPWLKQKYGVPIDFVPFGLFRAEGQIYLKISKIDVEPIVSAAEWAGDWFFNSNERFGPGTYKKMLEQSVIAAKGYGHAKTLHKMNLPSKGERVFVFLNGSGIIAVGEVNEDEAFQSMSVFGDAETDEYHRRVKWLHIVDPGSAVMAGECSQQGYNLPVRCTIGKMYNANVAGFIAAKLSEREKK